MIKKDNDFDCDLVQNNQFYVDVYNSNYAMLVLVAHIVRHTKSEWLCIYLSLTWSSSLLYVSFIQSVLYIHNK